MSAPAFAAMLVTVACATVVGCGPGTCRTVESTRRGASGSVSYRTADGLHTFDAATATIWSMGKDSLTLDAQLQDTRGERRSVRIELGALHVGATQHASIDATAQLCVTMQTGAPPSCIPLQGTIDVRRLEADCTGTQGVAFCAENIDASMHLATTQDGLDVKIDLDVISQQRWGDTKCTGD